MADNGEYEVLDASDEVTDCSHGFEQVHSPNVNPNEETLSHISESIQTEPINDLAGSEAITDEVNTRQIFICQQLQYEYYVQ